MSGPRDMTRPNWKRTVAAARRKMAELRDLDVQCVEPENFDTPPSERNGRPASPEAST